MPEYAQAVGNYLLNVQHVVAELDIAEIDAVCNIFKKAYQEERTIFVMGNGGIASTA